MTRGRGRASRAASFHFFLSGVVARCSVSLFFPLPLSFLHLFILLSFSQLQDEVRSRSSREAKERKRGSKAVKEGKEKQTFDSIGSTHDFRPRLLSLFKKKNQQQRPAAAVLRLLQHQKAQRLPRGPRLRRQVPPQGNRGGSGGPRRRSGPRRCDARSLWFRERTRCRDRRSSRFTTGRGRCRYRSGRQGCRGSPRGREGRGERVRVGPEEPGVGRSDQPARRHRLCRERLSCCRCRCRFCCDESHHQRFNG